MSYKKIEIENEILIYAQPIVEQFNFELVDLEFVKEGQNFYLRVFIDKDGGITIDDCEIVSRSLDKVLDEHDPISNPYILEVSSPGIDRPLKKESDFLKNIGKIVDVKLYKPVNKQKEFQGTLLRFCDNIVSINTLDDNIYDFLLSDIAVIRLAVIFK